MTPATVHLTRTRADHATAVTLCGMKLRTDYQAVQQVKTSGPWVSCPLCEAALALADITPDQPKGWIQPTFTGMEQA